MAAPAARWSARSGRIEEMSWEALPPLCWALGTAILAWRSATLWSRGAGFDLHPIYLGGRALADHHAIYTVPFYAYPPSAALLVAPLTAVGFPAVAKGALIVFPVLVVGTVVMAARCVDRSIGSAATAIGVALAALSGIVPEALGLENLSVLVAFLGAGAFLAWTRQREWTCGLLLGATLAIKPLFAPLCIALIVLRRWRALAAAGGVFLLLNVAALAVDPTAVSGGWRRLADVLAGRGAFSGLFEIFNSALVSVGHLLGWSSWLTLAGRCLIVVAAVCGATATWRTRPEPARSLEAGGLLLAGFYLATSVFESHWTLVLIPFAFASVMPGSPLRRPPILLGALLASELVILPHQITRFGPYGTDTVVRSLGLCLVVVATAIVTVQPALPSARARTPRRGRAPSRVTTT